MKRLQKAFLVLIMALGYGCTGGPAETAAPVDHPPTLLSPVATQHAVSTPYEETPAMIPPSLSIPQNLIDRAMQDLQQRFSIPASAIHLVESAAVTWPDASLGCPEEGFEYAQVLTPGYLIVLEYANTKYEYHAGKESTVIYCPNPQPPIPNDPGNT